MSKKVRLNRAAWTADCGRGVGEFMLEAGEHAMRQVKFTEDQTQRGYYQRVTVALFDLIAMNGTVTYQTPESLWGLAMQCALYMETYYAGQSAGRKDGEAHAHARENVELLRHHALTLLMLSPEEMFEVVDEDDEPEGDDLCDFCMRSGIEVECTIEGKTACADCAAEQERAAAEELAIDVNSYVQTYGSVEARLLWAWFLRAANMEGVMR